jgi:spermidine synthase
VKPRELIGEAEVPGGPPLRLVSHDGAFIIMLDRNELMSSRMSGSEKALATMTCERLGARPAPRLLIGGYGMGLTLRAALAELGDDASIVVAELVPGILEWARGPMAAMTGGCLDDPRVEVVIEDVGAVIEAGRRGYDAILLDVDNGPDGLTRPGNDGLYDTRGLARARAALKPGGVLAVWSAGRDPAFTRRLANAGFAVEEVRVRARENGKGPMHVIWFATAR